MTRTTPPLQQHLLTRSDLARMGVPAAQILGWLAENAIEQVGTLGEPGAEDPVFTVAGPLRTELVTKLATIGKTTVVLSPLRVRSFLLRAMLPQAAAAATTVEATELPDLADMLEEAAKRIEADVDAVLQLATEEAQLEASDPEAAVELDVETPADAMPADPEPEAPPTEAEVAPETCFDFDDLASELDELLGGEPIATNRTIDDAFTELLFEEPSAPPPEELHPTPEEPSPMEPEAEAEANIATIAADPMPESEAVAESAQPEAAFAPEPEPAPVAADLPAAASVVAEPAPQLEPQAATATDAAGGTEPTATNSTEPMAAPEPVESAMAAEPAAVPADPLDVILADPEPSVAPEPIAQEQEPAPPTEEVHEPPAAAAAPPDLGTDAVPQPASASPTTAPAEVVGDGTRVDAALAATNEAMRRVESFLDQLKGALVEMAQRPPVPVAAPVAAPPTIDVAPLVAALQSGFDRSAQQSQATSAALSALTEKLGSIGQHVEHGVQQAVTELRREPPTVERNATELVITRTDRTPIAMFSLMALVMAWSALFWFKTGSTRLALGTLVGANVVACCLLAARRRR